MGAFLRLWVWFSFRQFRHHPWRVLAVLFGIGLGAAVFTSVRLATNASVQAFANSVDAISGKADLTVARPGGRVPEGLVAVLSRVGGVRAASPLLTAYVRNEGDDTPLLLVGMDPILDRPFRSWKSEQGDRKEVFSQWSELFRSPKTLLAGRNFLRKKGLSPGDSVRLQNATRSQSFRIVGELVPGGLASLEGGSIAIADIATFQEFMGLFGEVDRIDIILYPDRARETRNEIAALLPPGIFVEQPSDAKETGQAMIRSYQLNLSVLSFVSLFVGMFLVYSLISLHATSRRKELAILRATGASSRILFLLFLAEGSFLGLSGWGLAMPVSLFMTERLLGTVSSTISHLFVRVSVDGLVLTPWEVLLSLAVTVLVSVVAACQPAFEACRVRAREALLMREAVSDGEAAMIRNLALLGLALMFAVLLLSGMPAFSGIPVSGYLAALFLFLGFALLSPFCLKLSGASLPELVRRAGGGETAYLGTRYLRSAGARVAISAGALITAIGLFTAVVIMVHSFRETVSAWVHQSINGDLYVRAKMSDVNRYRDPLLPEVVAELEKMRGEVDVVAYRRIFLDYKGTPYVLEPIDMSVYLRRSSFVFLEGDADKAATALVTGTGALVSEVYANRTGLHAGAHFTADVEGARLSLPIVGVIRDYRTQGGVVHCSLDYFARATGDRSWTGASVFLKDRGNDPDARTAALKNRLLLLGADKGYGLEAMAGAELRKRILRIFDETFSITTVLLVISLMIAALGIATTLTILVLERAWQFGTMMATGASAGQVRSVIGWEAVMMVILGEALGLLCGFILSGLLIFVINKQSFGWTFVYSIDWKSLAGSFPLVCLTALLATIPAARIVFRQSPATVLKGK